MKQNGKEKKRMIMTKRRRMMRRGRSRNIINVNFDKELFGSDPVLGKQFQTFDIFRSYMQNRRTDNASIWCSLKFSIKT